MTYRVKRSMIARPILCAAVISALGAPVFSETLTLEQVIREVCTKSDSVKMMKESVKKANEMVREKMSNALPVISASATGAKSRGSAIGGSGSSGSSSRQIAAASLSDDGGAPMSTPVDPRYVTWQSLGEMFEAFSKPQTSTIYSTSISVTQPIFTFGKIGTAIKVAKTFNESAHRSFERNLQTLQLAAIDGFYLVSIGDKSVDIARRSLERKIELNEFLDRNFRLGSGLRAQVLSTKAEVMLQVSRVIDAKKNAAKGRMFLSFLTGRPIADSVDLDTSVIPAELRAGGLPEQSEAVKSALENRKDITSLRLLAESTRGGVKIFRAMYLPSIAAFGSAGWSKYESGAKLFANNGMGNWMVGIGASWLFFDGFAYSAKAAQFASDAGKLDIAAAELLKGVEIEIRDAILESKAADSNLVASQQMFAAAREGYDLTHDNFKQGSGQLADLQRVDDQLQMAELGLLSARYRQIKSRAALIVAMGQNIITIDSEELK